jgi:hypothetical protein
LIRRLAPADIGRGFGTIFGFTHKIRCFDYRLKSSASTIM